jgi:peptidoglycan L-alanyl-D-glutamate endopeptidase CwlK
MQGVNVDLVRVVETAIGFSGHDFIVTEGLRTLERQKDLFKRGLTQTMDSRHLTGDAVDLSAVHKGKIVWDWPAYFIIADAMIQAAKLCDVAVRWGGAWHCDDVRTATMTAEELSSEYVALRRQQGRKPFLDGPHYEISR